MVDEDPQISANCTSAGHLTLKLQYLLGPGSEVLFFGLKRKKMAKFSMEKIILKINQ